MSTSFKLQPLTAAIAHASYIALSVSALTVSTAALADDVTAQTTHDSSTHGQYASDRTVQLTPIVVTAQQDQQQQALIVTADPKQPIQPIPASDGAAYLRSIMGFNSLQSGGTNGDVTFRGMFGSRIKILTDGTENLGSCPGRMDAPTSYIAPESFDKITVIKGPQTVLYANSGSAATVLFERQAPKFDKDQHYQGNVSVVAGSNGRLDHNVDAAVGNAEFYARLNANRSKSNSYKDGDGRTVPSSWEKWSSDVALGWTPDADTQVELRAGKSDGESLYAGRSMDGVKFARESLGLSVKKQNLSEYLKAVEAQVDYNFNDHVMDNFSLRPFNKMGGMSMKMASNPARKTLNSRLNSVWQWNQWQLQTGIDHQSNEHLSRSGMLNTYVTLPRKKDMKFESYGAFAELGYDINAEHKLITGARVDDVKVDDLRVNSATFNQERKKTLPSGFIRLENEHSFTSGGQGKSYVGIGHVERMPDYWELFSPKRGNAGSINAFEGVNPEKTTQLDIGYSQDWGKLSLSTSAYAGLIQDYILITYQPFANSMSKGLTSGAKNVDAQIAGVETSLSYQWTDRWMTDANLAYAWGKNTTDHMPLPQIAPLEARFNLKYVTDQYSIGAYLRSVAKQSRIAYQQGNIVGYDLAQTAGFSTFALNGTYRISSNTDLAVGVDNVFDKTYHEHLNKAGNAGFGYASEQQINNPGRNYWARISMKF